MASKVFFADARQARLVPEETLPMKLDRILDALNLRERVKDDPQGGRRRRGRERGAVCETARRAGASAGKIHGPNDHYSRESPRRRAREPSPIPENRPGDEPGNRHLEWAEAGTGRTAKPLPKGPEAQDRVEGGAGAAAAEFPHRSF